MRKNEQVDVPLSRLKMDILQLMKEEGFIQGFEGVQSGNHPVLRIKLKYHKDSPVITGLKRVSTPGRRVYVKKEDVPNVLEGLGTAILSTTQGVLTDRESRNRGIGGEVLCYVW